MTLYEQKFLVKLHIISSQQYLITAIVHVVQTMINDEFCFKLA